MRVLFVIALAAAMSACSAHGSTGPAWPRSAARGADGGESLAPRAAARAIAAIVEDDRAADRAAAAAPAAAAPEDPLMTEEIVIEVED
jgi:hypothetical protein